MADTKLSALATAAPVAGSLIYGETSGTSKAFAASALQTFVRGTLTTGTDAATTCVTNSIYVVDMSAWATADRNYTMPASPTVGDRVGILIQAGNASFELIIKGNTSQTINGGSSASEWSRLFITGEYVELLYVASNTWMVAIDKRIAQKGVMRLSTSASAETAATWTQPTAKGGAWTADVDIGSVCTVASDKVTARRESHYNVSIGGTQGTNVTDTKYFGIEVTKTGTTNILIFNLQHGGATDTFAVAIAALSVALAVDDTLTYRYISEEGSIGLASSASPMLNSFLSFQEVF